MLLALVVFDIKLVKRYAQERLMVEGSCYDSPTCLIALKVTPSKYAASNTTTKTNVPASSNVNAIWNGI